MNEINMKPIIQQLIKLGADAEYNHINGGITINGDWNIEYSFYHYYITNINGTINYFQNDMLPNLILISELDLSKLNNINNNTFLKLEFIDKLTMPYNKKYNKIFPNLKSINTLITNNNLIPFNNINLKINNIILDY